MREPISKPLNARFRGPTSSAEQNESERNKYTDIVQLFEQSNTNFLQIKQAYETVLVENHFLNSYAESLQTEMGYLSSRISALETGIIPFINQDRKFVKDMTVVFPNPIQTVNEVPAQIEAEYNISRINSINSVPKTYLVDINKEHIVPSSLSVAVKRTNEGKGFVETTPFSYMFDGDETSFWKYNVAYNDPADIRAAGEEIDVTITLPINISSQKKVNCISLNTHPSVGIEILNLEIFYNNQWTRIYDDSTINISKNGRHKWIFQEMFAELIRFTMIQKTGIVQGGETRFYMGIQEMNITYEMFTKSTNYVLVPFEMNGMYDIESVDVTFLNRSALSYSALFDKDLYENIYTYKVMYEDSLGILHVMNENDWVSQTYQKIWIQVNMNLDVHNGVAPCLYSVQMNYKQR